MDKIQHVFDTLISKWWFYLLFLMLFFLPSYTSRPFDARNTSDLITAVLSAPIIYSYPAIMPLFKLIPLLLIAVVLRYGNRAAPILLGYVTLLMLAMATLQNSAYTELYGLAILSGNVIVYIIVALVWALDLYSRQTDFQAPTHVWWRYWVIPVALLAFWFPVNESTLTAEFSLTALVSNSAGLTTCMMLPLWLALVSLYHPRVNRVTLRISSYAGLITGLLNVLQWFFLSHYIWMGVLHLPLLIIAGYTFWLSFKTSPFSSPSTKPL